MKVKCISNRLEDLPRDYFMPRGRYHSEARISQSITEGREYCVYALQVGRGQTYFYLCDDQYSNYPPLHYPQANPAPLFEVVDATMPACWRIQVFPDGLFLAFDEWIESEYFYDRLTDGEDGSIIEAWRRSKALVEAESDCTSQ